jgi:hypothetical protein
MSGPTITGGGGISLDDVYVAFGFGVGLDTSAGSGGKYLNKFVIQGN